MLVVTFLIIIEARLIIKLIHRQNKRSFELLKDYVDPPPGTLTITSIIANNFGACSPISFQHMSFWCPFLDPRPNHSPLKYRCLLKTRHQFRHIYLTSSNQWVFSLLSKLIVTCFGPKSLMMFERGHLQIYETIALKSIARLGA